jgi:NAD(P)-dependent dehydrogenase (short-subunit alcohol dehydrogenase family)
MSSLKGKVVLITGGTSGIGRAAAVAFAKEGSKVVISGRRDEEGAATVKLIQAAGGEGLFIRGDVSRKADVENLVRKTVEKYGRLDVAFNNAGIEDPSAAFHEHSDDTFDKVFAINVKGLWWSMQAEIRQMLKQGGGAIVNTSSIAGLIGFPTHAPYVATKHAVIGLTKNAALEFAKQGIRVNAVAPAAIRTEMIERFAPDAQSQDYLASLHPIGRIGRPEEVAAAVVWLSSDAASFVTGQTLATDGGFTAQ